MNASLASPLNQIQGYSNKLQGVLAKANWHPVASLATDVIACWKAKGQIFLCGNGGSAGNAIHLANDFIYGVAKESGKGIKVTALSANPAVITCLANDIGYESIYSEQLAVLGNPGDILIALSGSGNSPNIVKAIEKAKQKGVKTYSILGFDGGICKEISDVAIHFDINDMQIAEDLQLIVGHMLMQYLYSNKDEI
jgi:D-sedoheptulose 7-phosphate isomerase